MRRWLLALLLVSLPLQSLWAAVAFHCNSTHAVQAAHTQHHGHEHQETETSLSSVEGADQPSADHPDCHACHGHGIALPASAELARPGLSIVPMSVEQDVRVASAPVALPDRPNWTPLA